MWGLSRHRSTFSVPIRSRPISYAHPRGRTNSGFFSKSSCLPRMRGAPPFIAAPPPGFVPKLSSRRKAWRRRPSPRTRTRVSRWRSMATARSTSKPLSMGLAPEGLHAYITQRSRWCLGAIQQIYTRVCRASTPAPDQPLVVFRWHVLLDLHFSFQDPHANRARALLVNGDGRDRRRRQRLD
jgi:hypothetical protein